MTSSSQDNTAFKSPVFLQHLQNQGNIILAKIKQEEEDYKPKPLKDGNINDDRKYNVMIVMRHSKRIDQHPVSHLSWGVNEYLRSYDPPLSDFILPKTIVQTELLHFIPNLNINKIITSPFLRCVQTSAIIGKEINVKHFEIDARLGENSLAINRCINRAKRKLSDMKSGTNANKHEFELPVDIPCKSFHDIQYLDLESIRSVICDIYAQSVVNEEIEQKSALNKIDIQITWDHRELPGNNLHLECVKEKRKELKSEKYDVLLVTHAQIVCDISEELNDKLLIRANECGWILITEQECCKIYSPSAVKIVYDPNKKSKLENLNRK